MHRINFRLSPRHKGLAFDLVEPIVMVKHRDVGIAAIRHRNAKLTPIDGADSVLNVELDNSILNQLVHRVVDQRALLAISRHFRNRNRECAGLLSD